MSLNDYSQARNDQVSVGASSTIIEQENNQRKAIVLRNSSTGGQIISISFGELSAVASNGIVLSPGQAFSDADSENYTCWKGRIQAISSAVGGVLSVFAR